MTTFEHASSADETVTDDDSEINDDYPDYLIANFQAQKNHHPVSVFSSLLETDNAAIGTYRISAVAFKSAPLMMTYFNHNPLTILLDTGAENNIISTSIVKRLNVKIFQTPSRASQVDKSLLKSVGRIVIPIYNGNEVWTYDALVCDNVGDVIIGGNPLLDQGINPVTYRNEIDIVTNEGSIRKLPWRPQTSRCPSSPNIGILRCQESVTLYPGEFVDIQAPPAFQSIGDAEVLVRPRSSSNVYSVYMSTTKYSRDLFPKHKHIADISLVSSGVFSTFPIFSPSSNYEVFSSPL